MANFICYGTQRINPVADATINLVYDANVNSDAVNEVRLLIDSTLTVPATVDVNLPQIANFDGIFNVQIFVVDSGNNASVKDIVVTPFAGDTINGGASITLSTDGSSAIIQIADGTHWYALV
jgi:hypothetical protein